MADVPGVSAALCGLYDGARVVLEKYPEGGPGTAMRRLNDGWWFVRFDDGDFGWWPPEALVLPLDTPLAMCHVARWLAERAGHTVKNWAVFEEDTRREVAERFKLKQYVLRADGMTVAFFADSTLKNGGWGRAMFFVDGLGAAESHADAIRMTCLSVGGAS